ncbi:unnamed protein product, partial [Musa hybrid cultivar]
HRSVTVQKWKHQKLLLGSNPVAPSKQVTSSTVSLDLSYLFPFPPRLLQRDHKSREDQE